MLQALPDLYYNIGKSALDPKILAAKNLWRRADILSEYKNSITWFNEYLIRNGERPEDIALDLYKNPFYNWTLLVINDIVNIYEQWPRSVKQLQEYVTDKYPNPEDHKHYETVEVKFDTKIIVPAGKIVPSNFQVSYWNGSVTVTANPVASVTYYQYEEKLNSAKESIQVIRPSVIEDFVAAYESRLSRGSNLSLGFDASDLDMS